MTRNLKDTYSLWILKEKQLKILRVYSHIVYLQSFQNGETVEALQSEDLAVGKPQFGDHLQLDRDPIWGAELVFLRHHPALVQLKVENALLPRMSANVKEFACLLSGHSGRPC